jgi:hypothetical protein
MGGATIVPRIVLRLSGKNFKIGQQKFNSHKTLLYLVIIDFPKFDPLTATGMALCVNFEPKCKNSNSCVPLSIMIKKVVNSRSLVLTVINHWSPNNEKRREVIPVVNRCAACG